MALKGICLRGSAREKTRWRLKHDREDHEGVLLWDLLVETLDS